MYCGISYAITITDLYIIVKKQNGIQGIEFKRTKFHVMDLKKFKCFLFDFGNFILYTIGTSGYSLSFDNVFPPIPNSNLQAILLPLIERGSTKFRVSFGL